MHKSSLCNQQINKEIFITKIEIKNSCLFLKRKKLNYIKVNLRRKTFEQEKNFYKGNSLLYSDLSLLSVTI